MATRSPVFSSCLNLACAAALVAANGAQAAPAAGDAWVYRMVNAYSKEPMGNVRYEVLQAAPDRVVLQVTPDRAAAGAQRTEIHTPQGNWLRGPIESHGVPVEYVFATAYPAYVFPLDPGKRWSERVGATVAAPAGARSVRVDGQVLGTERIRVPAGEFETVKVRRFVYPGDADFRNTETRITEIDWYAPALGRPVRTERRSAWVDTGNCPEQSDCTSRGDWSVLELVTPPR